MTNQTYDTPEKNGNLLIDRTGDPPATTRICYETGVETNIDSDNMSLMDVPENHWSTEPEHTATTSIAGAGEINPDQILKSNVRKANA